MKHLKKFESSDWKEITYDEYRDMTYTEEFTEREQKEITEFLTPLINNTRIGINKVTNKWLNHPDVTENRIYFCTNFKTFTKQYVIYKYDDDWFTVKNLNGTEIWKCDQMHGLKELLKKITD